MTAPLAASARGPTDSDLLAPLAPSGNKKGSAKKGVPPKPASRRAIGGKADPLSPLARTRIWVKVPHGTKGATLFIDDRDLGTLPVPKLDLPAGDHLVVVKRPGFLDFTRQISLPAGQTLEVPVTFEPSPGTLSVFADVEGAQVTINGRSIGTTPVSGLVLPPGPQELRVTREGYQDVVLRLTVHAGRDEPVVVKMAPLSSPPLPSLREAPAGSLLNGGEVRGRMKASKPWYSRWYVWTAVGAVVAGGVVTSLVLLRPGKESPERVLGTPPDGTLNFLTAQPQR